MEYNLDLTTDETVPVHTEVTNTGNPAEEVGAIPLENYQIPTSSMWTVSPNKYSRDKYLNNVPGVVPGTKVLGFRQEHSRKVRITDPNNDLVNGPRFTLKDPTKELPKSLRRLESEKMAYRFPLYHPSNTNVLSDDQVFESYLDA